MQISGQKYLTLLQEKYFKNAQKKICKNMQKFQLLDIC